MDQIIPLDVSPNQTLLVPLAINGGITRLNLFIYYNDIALYWVMNVKDQYLNDIISGIPLITGDWPAANLLRAQQYLGIGSCYIVNNSNTVLTDYPNDTNLGTGFLLLWSDNVK